MVVPLEIISFALIVLIQFPCGRISQATVFYQSRGLSNPVSMLARIGLTRDKANMTARSILAMSPSDDEDHRISDQT